MPQTAAVYVSSPKTSANPMTLPHLLFKSPSLLSPRIVATGTTLAPQSRRRAPLNPHGPTTSPPPPYLPPPRTSHNFISHLRTSALGSERAHSDKDNIWAAEIRWAHKVMDNNGKFENLCLEEYGRLFSALGAEVVPESFGKLDVA